MFGLTECLPPGVNHQHMAHWDYESLTIQIFEIFKRLKKDLEVLDDVA